MARKKIWNLEDPGDALLYQVWQEPENEERLSVYADWLLENGDATRGEYMQLALVPKPTAAQAKRRDALLRKHRGAWLGRARPYVWTWQDSESSPGFVETASCAVAKLKAGLEYIRMLGPRCCVSLKPVVSAAERTLLSTIPLGRLYGLRLSETDTDWVTDRLIAAIAPNLEGLRSLAVLAMSDRFTTAALGKLLATESLTELTFHTAFRAGDPAAWMPTLLASARPALQHVQLDKPSAKWRKQLAARFRWVDYGHA